MEPRAAPQPAAQMRFWLLTEACFQRSTSLEQKRLPKTDKTFEGEGPW